MSIPTEIDFVRGVAPSALLEEAVRSCLAAVDPLEGWVVSTRVVLAGCMLQDGRLLILVTLTFPTLTLTATRHRVAPTPDGVARAVTQAIERLLPAAMSQAALPSTIERGGHHA